MSAEPGHRQDASTKSWSSFAALTASQSLGAFNDNFFKQFMILLALHLSEKKLITLSWWPEDPQSLMAGLFTIPFVIFALIAGHLADKYSKRKIIVLTNISEFAIMGLAATALFIGQENLNLGVLIGSAVLFLMASQSAFFGPSKYGIIPELVPEERLSQANGIISMTTNLSIILGTICAGALITKTDLPETTVVGDSISPSSAGLLFMGVAFVGFLISLLIKKTKAADPERPFSKSMLWIPGHALKELKFVRKDRELFLALLASSWFWMIGSCLFPVLNLYGKENLGMGLAAGTELMTWLFVGVAVGSILTAIISGPRVELGLVPLGIVGLGVCFAIIGWSDFEARGVKTTLGFAGLFSGFFVVPLTAFLQQRPAPEDKGRVMGAAELLNFIFICVGVVVVYATFSAMGLTPSQMFQALAIITLFGAVLICMQSSQYIVRLGLLIFTKSLYRIRVLNSENVPLHDGALIVSNHVSYADPFLVGATLPRHIRYLMHRSFLKVPIVGWFGRLMRAIPISSDDAPRQVLKSLGEARKHVEEGGVSCIFAEGSISRTGNLLPFSKGLERIAKKSNKPIIPVYLDRVWGSIFSYRGGRFFFKMPLRMPYPITVVYGKPLPCDTPAYKVREAVQQLSAEAMEDRKKRGATLATRFVRIASRFPWRKAMTDHTGRELSYFSLLVSTLAMRAILRSKLESGTKHVGVLLPPSIGGAIANITLAIIGKISVNLNFTAGEAALDSAKKQCNIKNVLTSRAFIEKIGVEEQDEHLFMEDLVSSISKAQKIRYSLIALLPAFILNRMPDIPHDPDQAATVIFSSGSTGEPKGVCLSHHNIFSNCQSATQAFDLHKDDKLVGVLPFFHSFGYTATLWLPMLNGNMAVYHPNPSEAAAINDVIKKHKGTVFFSTPTFYMSYLRRWKKEDIESIRTLVSGAEKLKSSLSKMWFERFGIPIFEGYGCTELSPVASINLPNVDHPDAIQIAHKEGTIGHPLPGIAARIVDPETDEELPPHKEGMLLIKGPNVMMGYLGQPEKTAEVIKDGWYTTGDIAKIDDDGFITITDRLSRFSKIGGEMVPHLKVEEFVQQIVDQSSKEACEIAVSSIPSEQKGEKLVVLHTKTEMESQEIVSELRQTELPKLWIPRPDAFTEVEEIPKLATGKLDLRRVKEIAAERFSD